MNLAASLPAASNLADQCDAGSCFHCARAFGQIVAERIPVQVDGVLHDVCCQGCAAALAFIGNAGLGDYYRLRERRPQAAQRREALEVRWRHLDRSDALDALTREVTARGSAGRSCREVLLELPDMTCAACAWLLESVLQRHPDTVAMSDLGTQRLRVRFDPVQTPLSRLLATTASFGYPATPIAASAEADADSRRRRRELIALGIAGIGAMQVMMLSIGRYLDVGADLGTLEWQGMAIVEAMVTTTVLATAGLGLLRGGWAALSQGRVTVDAPLALGIVAGWLVSMAALGTGGALYFDAITMLVFLTLGSRYLQARLERRGIIGLDSPTLALRVIGRNAISPVDFAAAAALDSRGDSGQDVATHADPDNGATIALRAMGESADERTEVVPASLLLAGDLAWVRSGERIPADGLVAGGEGACDESALTGEALPVQKRLDDHLFAGTLNLGQPLLLRVLRPLSASRLQHLRDSARALADTRALRPAWIDRIGHAYGLCMLAVALLAALGWCFVAPERAPGILLSVLVIACPCALAVAIPATIAAANSGLLRRGALVSQASVFERVATIDTVVLDKTGTLTRVQSARCTPAGWRDSRAAGRSPDERILRAVAATLERHATHPYARLLAAAPTDGVAAANDVQVGREGVSGLLEDRRWRIGTPGFAFPASEVAGPAAGIAQHVSSGVWLTCDGDAVARFDFELDVNPGVPQALAALRGRGWTLRIASGDAAASVEAVARVLGIHDWDAGLRAEDKLALVARLQGEGHHVLMVGDGTNDASALARADIGIAVAPGTALCQASAGARLLRPDLRLLVDLLDAARHGRHIMRSNLGWALGYNAIALPLAAFGLIPPLWAAIGMSASSLVVVVNALRAGATPADSTRP